MLGPEHPGGQQEGSREDTVSTPSVAGPVEIDPPGGPARSRPFLFTDLDLAARRYQAEEFFFSGTASSYDLPIPTVPLEPAQPSAEPAGHRYPYTSRLLVYRPDSPDAFNGTVFVEWTNTTIGHEVPLWWNQNFDYIMRTGAAHVTITANHYAIHGEPYGLRNWSPQRYGNLDVPLVRRSTAEADPRRYDDQLAYDVFAQGLQAIRSVPKVLGGLAVRHVIAGGVSRAAVHLGAYLNSRHPRAPLVDGALLLLAGPQLRVDLDVPVMKVLSETDVESFDGRQATGRQDDTERFRTWWMTGTSHVDHHMATSHAAARLRDLPDVPLWDDGQPTGHSRVQAHLVISAAMEAMEQWLEDGPPPARSPLPQLTPTDPPQVVRDEHGNGLGGIRLATLDAPTATDQGTGAGLNFLVGRHVPFDQPTLSGLYPGHASYVRAVAAAVRKNVHDGFLLAEDADHLIARSLNSIIGEGLASGPLCADAGNFANNPSTVALRDHTEIYRLVDGDALVATLDRATRLVAEGYTAAAAADHAVRKQRFDEAGELVREYRHTLLKKASDDPAVADPAGMLAGLADVLITAIAAAAV